MKKAEKIKILENATVVYFDSDKVVYDAIYITDKMVFFGRILNQNFFMIGGGIPSNSIKRIEGGIDKEILKCMN